MLDTIALAVVSLVIALYLQARRTARGIQSRRVAEKDPERRDLVLKPRQGKT